MLLWALMATIFGTAGWMLSFKLIVMAEPNWELAQDYRVVKGEAVQHTTKPPAARTNRFMFASKGASMHWRYLKPTG